MIALTAVLTLASVSLLLHRLPSRLPARAEPAGSAQHERPDRRRLLVAVATAAATVTVLPAMPGLLLSPVLAWVTWRFVPAGTARSDRLWSAQLRRDAPLACDLLSAALLAGAPIENATSAVACALGGPVGGVLGDVSAALSLGAAPQEAWAIAERAPPLRGLALAAVRASHSGAGLAAAATRCAADLRQRAELDGQVAARRAGVRIVAPLALCFLPAFVVLGIVPFVVGLFHHLLH